MSIDYFWHQYADRMRSARPGSWALLCNQTAYSYQHKAYLLQLMQSTGALGRVFLPEHGLFAELQDQIALDDASVYAAFCEGPQFVSLYGSQESSLVVAPEHLKDLAVLVVDLQDVGSRYYTFATTVSYIFDQIAELDLELEIVVIERPNPAGRQVEGSMLAKDAESFVGRPGLPHRHGLTLGELCQYYKAASGARAPLTVVFDPELAPESFFQSGLEMGAARTSWEIPPSPNMPSPVTPLVYAGQCLLEGTNLSEGRGTTRPFEIFGAAGMHLHRAVQLPEVSGAILRPLRFLPTFHKHGGKLCEGWQIHLDGTAYHSLGHSLQILRAIQDAVPEFAYLHGVYEYRSDKPAIELLAGDPLLIEHLYGKENWSRVAEYLAVSEQAWIQQAAPCLIHAVPLYSVSGE